MDYTKLMTSENIHIWSFDEKNFVSNVTLEEVLAFLENGDECDKYHASLFSNGSFLIISQIDITKDIINI